MPVIVNITIQSIQKVSEVDMKFAASFLMEAMWFDTRLTWNDLNKNPSLNRPSRSQKGKFWVPKIVFGNTEKSEQIPMDEKQCMQVNTGICLDTELILHASVASTKPERHKDKGRQKPVRLAPPATHHDE